MKDSQVRPEPRSCVEWHSVDHCHRDSIVETATFRHRIRCRRVQSGLFSSARLSRSGLNSLPRPPAAQMLTVCTQSPQLAKQMCIAGDMGRVYEIGPVFRAENSNTHRHLTEYTGLDLEMEIDNHYHEVMNTLDQLFLHIFRGLYKDFRDEVTSSYPRHRASAFTGTPVDRDGQTTAPS